MSTEFKPEYKKKDIRSYVIRSGRMTDGQRLAFDKHWQDYGLSLHDGLLQLDDVFGRRSERILEIGFGMGDSLLQMAQSAPEQDFIGIEVHPPGVGRLISEAARAGVTNIKVFMADAVDVLDDCFANDSLHRIQIFFPDPWHKKKHHKRRLIQSAFVQKLRSKLVPAGILHFATDWQDYAEHMMEVMCSATGFENTAADYSFSPCPDYRPVTKFERRGERLGHGVWDIVFRRA